MRRPDANIIRKLETVVCTSMIKGKQFHEPKLLRAMQSRTRRSKKHAKRKLDGVFGVLAPVTIIDFTSTTSKIIEPCHAVVIVLNGIALTSSVDRNRDHLVRKHTEEIPAPHTTGLKKRIYGEFLL